jgi:hypothetical protein
MWVRLPPSAPVGNGNHLGAWLSLVERSVRVAEVGGSNPLAPTSLHHPASRERPAGWLFGLTHCHMSARIQSLTIGMIS